MSFLDDLANAAERIADKVLDFRAADAGIIRDANAAQTEGAPVGSVTRSPLSSFDLQRAMPFIVIGGVVIVGAAVLLRR